MIQPKLYVFNIERDLITTNIEYHKHYNKKTGLPGDIPLGGLITVTFASGNDDDVLLRWITNSEEGKLCTLTKGKIVFYYMGGFGEKLCEYRFADAGLVYWKETFDAKGPEPMIVTMIISAAIQEFREQTLIKHWHESETPQNYQSGLTNASFITHETKAALHQAEFENEQKGSWVAPVESGGYLSSFLRKESKVVAWLTQQGDQVAKDIIEDLLAQVDKPVKETLEDSQGRLTLVLDRPGQSNKVVCIHATSKGQYIVFTYTPAYNPSLNPNISVPLSANRLVPDYMGTEYMHPLQGDEVVKIKLSGNRNTDFSLARAELGISKADEIVNGVNYTWHHMDDFEIINGGAYGTMQLVKSSVHQGTGITGMQHSGSVSQWRAYYGSGY